MVELGFESLHFLEVGDEGGAGGVTLQVGHSGGRAGQALGLHELAQLLNSSFQLLDDHRGLVHQPDFARLFCGLLAAEEGDGGIDRILLLAEVEDVSVGLGAVEHAVGAREGLDQAVVLEVLVHIERVQELGVKAGEQHVHHDGDVDLLRGRVVRIGPLLVFDALLHVLVIQVELAQAVVGAEPGVVVGHDGFQCLFLFLRFDLVVCLLLRQVAGQLVDVFSGFFVLGQLGGR